MVNFNDLSINHVVFIKGDMFKGNHEALVNPINAVGAMGKGVALEMKLRYPDMFKRYREIFYELNEGSIWIYRTNLEFPKIIYNVVTKFHWKDKSKLITIEVLLDKLNLLVNRDSIKSIGIPALGCGCGGLAWRDVKMLMNEYFSHNDSCTFYCYEPIEY